MDEIFDFIGRYNEAIAIGTFTILGLACIITMIVSEWRCGEDWWRPKR